MTTYITPSLNYWCPSIAAHTAFALSGCKSPDSTWQFFAHLLIETEEEFKKTGKCRYIPKPKPYIEQFFKGARLQDLEQAGVIDILYKNVAQHLCVRCRVKPHILDLFLTVDELAGYKHEVNLFTMNKRGGTPKPANNYRDKSGNWIATPLHREVIAILSNTGVDIDMDIIDRTGMDLEARISTLDHEIAVEADPTNKKRKESQRTRFRRQLAIVRSARRLFFLRGSKLANTSIMHYMATFGIQTKGGRLTERGGGLLLLMKYIRAELFRNLHGYDAYDCHASLLGIIVGILNLCDRTTLADEMNCPLEIVKPARLAFIFAGGNNKNKKFTDMKQHIIRRNFINGSRAIMACTIQNSRSPRTPLTDYGNDNTDTNNPTSPHPRTHTKRVQITAANGTETHGGNENEETDKRKGKRKGKGKAHVYEDTIRRVIIRNPFYRQCESPAQTRRMQWSMRVPAAFNSGNIDEKQRSWILKKWYRDRQSRAINKKWANLIKSLRDKLIAVADAIIAKAPTDLKGFKIISNALGMNMRLEGSQDTQRKRTLSFILIGMEQFFILTLIKNLHAAGIKTLVYLYDGIYTDRPIPQSILDATAAETKITLTMKYQPPSA